MGVGVNPWLVGVLLVACAVATASQVATTNTATRQDVHSAVEDSVELVVQEIEWAVPEMRFTSPFVLTPLKLMVSEPLSVFA